MNEEELLKQGWRKCAVGQRTTQYCGMAEQARLEEREACAKLCDSSIHDTYIVGETGAEHYARRKCAAAIRARGNHD